MRDSWTDERLDDLNALYRLLVQGLIALVVAMIGGFATVLAAIIWV